MYKKGEQEVSKVSQTGNNNSAKCMTKWCIRVATRAKPMWTPSCSPHNQPLACLRAKNGDVANASPPSKATTETATKFAYAERQQRC